MTSSSNWREGMVVDGKLRHDCAVICEKIQCADGTTTYRTLTRHMIEPVVIDYYANLVRHERPNAVLIVHGWTDFGDDVEGHKEFLEQIRLQDAEDINKIQSES